jgi:hypothetical protein
MLTGAVVTGCRCPAPGLEPSHVAPSRIQQLFGGAEWWCKRAGDKHGACVCNVPQRVSAAAHPCASCHAVGVTRAWRRCLWLCRCWCGSELSHVWSVRSALYQVSSARGEECQSLHGVHRNRRSQVLELHVRCLRQTCCFSLHLCIILKQLCVLGMVLATAASEMICFVSQGTGHSMCSRPCFHITCSFRKGEFVQMAGSNSHCWACIHRQCKPLFNGWYAPGSNPSCSAPLCVLIRLKHIRL